MTQQSGTTRHRGEGCAPQQGRVNWRVVGGSIHPPTSTARRSTLASYRLDLVHTAAPQPVLREGVVLRVGVRSRLTLIRAGGSWFSSATRQRSSTTVRYLHIPRCPPPRPPPVWSSQGTVNGIGERTGNANLMTIIPTLQLKMGVKGVGERLSNLTALSRFTDEQVRTRRSPCGRLVCVCVWCVLACFVLSFFVIARGWFEGETSVGWFSSAVSSAVD